MAAVFLRLLIASPPERTKASEGSGENTPCTEKSHWLITNKDAIHRVSTAAESLVVRPVQQLNN